MLKDNVYVVMSRVITISLSGRKRSLNDGCDKKTKLETTAVATAEEKLQVDKTTSRSGCR